MVAVLDTPPEGGVHPVEVQAAVGRGPYHLTIRRIAAPPPPPPAPEVDPHVARRRRCKHRCEVVTTAYRSPFMRNTAC